MCRIEKSVNTECVCVVVPRLLAFLQPVVSVYINHAVQQNYMWTIVCIRVCTTPSDLTYAISSRVNQQGVTPLGDCRLSMYLSRDFPHHILPLSLNCPDWADMPTEMESAWRGIYMKRAMPSGHERDIWLFCDPYRRYRVALM